MNPEARRLVDRLWSYCNVLRDDGVSSKNYLEQLSFLVFLKMAHELELSNNSISDSTQHRYILPEEIRAKGRGWGELLDLTGSALERAYTSLLHDLGGDGEHDDNVRPHTDGDGEDEAEDDGDTPRTTLTLIFKRARNHIQNPANLRRLIHDLINKEDWSTARSDIQGDAYEALIARSVEDTKAGAGQYFTPRPLIESIVRVMRPTQHDTITDPACGTGGFLLAAYAQILRDHSADMYPEDYEHLASGRIWGTELVPETARLAAMNLLLHNIGAPDGIPLIKQEDALKREPQDLATLVLANPPFGTKSSQMISNEDETGNGKGKQNSNGHAYSRRDFWTKTPNKQLNFLQHIASLLDRDGRAAVIVPDNVLYESGNAATTIRRELLLRYDLHTMLRLPRGIFHAGGVSATVLFFDWAERRHSEDEPPRTQQIWTYDLRTGKRFTLKQNPLRAEHLADFEKAYRADDRSQRTVSERFQVHDGAALVKTEDVKLDLGLLTPEADEEESLPPGELVAAVVDDLRSALAEVAALAEELGVELTESADA
ncbi:HsdM family class I SAM-dependent methyltransferase [Streptomyces sp. NRRL S-1868]|uniref:HsdM family class I SAM-dependent methyltransferase n=1 Tax=Streptomyces sp. NRRL S-1868 TaxID=1463892 RepID=UPI0004C7CAB3|nr:class I SAM-dependent DNA methyltransferase [Streptomyces sp. NRRL S-1868]